MKNPLLSIIIPTYNEEKDIKKCIDSILNQTYRNFEIIIVDDGSIDKTREIVRKIKSKKVKLIDGEHKGPGYSRNLGEKHSKGKVLVFIDADMTLDENYLKYMIKPIIENNVIGTEEKKQLSSNPKNIWSRCWGAYSKKEEGNKGHIFRMILKSKFEELGGFDPKYGYADDLTFFLKYGLESKISEKAICYHKNPETLKEVYKQSRWIGASLRNKIFNIPILKYIIPFFMMILSPFLILFLSLKKSYKNKTWDLFFPYMIIFMTYRYFGTIEGLVRKIYFKVNIR